MNSKNNTPDYQALASKYDGMFRNIDRMQWDIGKSLYEDGIVSDGQRQRLGDLIGREPKTLKTYYEVYVNFHERWPLGRPENVSHGVLEQLNRLSDEKLRDEFFQKYAKPTRALAETFVNLHTITKGKRDPRKAESTSVTVGGVVFAISVNAAGSGRIEISGASKVGDTQVSLQGNTWIVDYLP